MAALTNEAMSRFPDLCYEPMDPSDPEVLETIEAWRGLPRAEQVDELQQLGLICLEACGSENVIHLDPSAVDLKCREARVTRVALAALGVSPFIEIEDESSTIT